MAICFYTAKSQRDFEKVRTNGHAALEKNQKKIWRRENE